MELDALKFTVETTALDDAITKVGTLQLAVKKLGSETATPKVIKADNIVSKDAEERVTKLNNVLERQQDILAFMASGFSKGQASVLAFGKTAGLATDQLKLLGDVLDTQRKLIGGDTFDKSNSALKALQNQYALLKDAARAYNDESSLTQKQLQGLGLDKERLLEKYKIEGKSLSDIKSALRDLNSEYNKAAISVNQQVAANTKLAIASKNTAAGQELANKAMAKADEMLARLQNRVQEMSKEGSVSATAANQLYAYEKALRAAGVGADDATDRLAVFRAEQQKVSQLSRAEETLRMQHLSRALAPQVTDVTVGLMTGQNPFTVFLQQGGQIRDQIGLSQVATENLGKVFKDTFVMMGAMVAAMGKALYAFFLTPIGAIVASAAVLALGIYKVTEMTYDFEKSMHLLNTALILSGNQAGITSDSLNGLTKEASKIEGISFSKAAEAMAMLAKTGEVSRDEFVKAAESAVLLEKYAGISVGETVKVYKELSKEPLKALIKINEETASFTSSIIKQVAELERQGEKEAAAELARKSYADATVVAAHNIQDSLQGLSKAMDIATTVGEKMWKVIKGGIGVDTNEAAIVSISTEIARIEKLMTVKQVGGLDVKLDNPIADKMLATLKEQLKYNQHIVDSDRDRAAWQEKSAADAKKTGEYQLELNKSITTEEKKRREIARIQITSVPTLEEAALNGPDAVRKAIAERDKAIHYIQTGKAGDKKAKEEKSDSLSFSLANDTAQARKQYDIQLKDQTDFVNQQKQRLDNSLAAKEISQGEFIAREIALVMKGEAEQSRIIEDSMVKEQENYAKDRASLTQQYKDWQAENKGMPDFVDVNKQKAEELQSKLGDLTNTFNSATEKLMASSDKVKETAFTRMIKQISELKGAIREVILEREKFQRSEDELLSKQKRQTAIEDKLRYASPEQAAFIQAQAQEQERLNAVIKVYNEELAKADINLKGYNAALVSEQDPEIIKRLQEQIVLMEQANEERRKSRDLALGSIDEKALVQAQNAQLKYQKDQMKLLSDSVAGALEDGLYKGAAEGAKSLRNIIEAELRKPITVFIKAVVGDILGGSLEGGSTSMLGSLGSAVSSSSLFSEGGSLAGAGVFASELGAGIANGFASTMAGASISSTVGVGSTVGGAAGTGLGIGAVAPYALAALAVYSLMKGNGGTPTATTGDANVSFGSTGNITGRKTSSDYFWGGSMTKAADDFVLNLNKTYLDTAKNLGIAAVDTYFSYSGNTGENGAKPNFAIRSSAGNQTYSSGETSLSDAAVSLAASRAVLNALQKSDLPKYLSGVFDGITVSSMTQEQITSSLAGATALKQFHDQLQLLPFESLKDLSYTATEELKYFSGGLDKFGTNLGTYYDKFYSTEEKNTVLLNNTRKAFEDLGLVLPDINDKTRTNYRAMVEELSAKDLSISKNAAAYAGILQLADSVDKLAPALDKTAVAIVDTVKILQDAANEAIATNNKLLQDKLQKATDQATSAMSALTKSVQAQKDANNALLTSQSDVIQSTLDGVSSSISKLKDLSNSLKSTLDSMRITGSDGDYRIQAQYQISQALQTARTGGGLPLDGQLTSALATVSKPSENLFGSFEDYARDFYRTANDISDLNDLTTKQLTADEVTQGILNKQLKEIKSGFDTENKALDDILKNAQLQFDSANGLDVTIKSVTESLKSFGDAILKLTSERATQDLATSRGVTYTKEDILAAVKASLEAGGSVADIYKAAALKFGVGASTITQATTGSGLVGFNQTPTKYSPEEILSAVKASLSQGATVADIYKAAYDKFGVTTAQVNAAVQGQGLSGFTTGAATGTQFSQDQMAAWLSQASAAGWSVAEMYNRALSDYGVSNSTLAQVGHAVGIPGFAVGTNYVPYDMTANIHKGERIIPAADNLMLMNTLSRVSYNQQGSNDSELKEELKDMKLLLKSALDKIADNTKQSADLLDAVTAGGNAMLTEAA